jgi:hypothetical protein
MSDPVKREEMDDKILPASGKILGQEMERLIKIALETASRVAFNPLASLDSQNNQRKEKIGKIAGELMNAVVLYAQEYPCIHTEDGQRMRRKYYRRIPEEVQALRFEVPHGLSELVPVDSWAGSLLEWCHGILVDVTEPIIRFGTPDGYAEASLGDWIIKDSHGYFSVCRNEQFELMYEAEQVR